MGSYSDSAVQHGRAFLLVLAVVANFSAFAQAPMLEADLSFQIDLDPSEPIPAGTVGEYTITMFNAGPDLGFPVVRSSDVPVDVIFTGPRDDNCFFVVTDFTRPPPFPPFLVYSMSSVGLLPVGESIQCSGNFFLPTDFEGSLPITWVIGNNSGGMEAGPTTDPNLSNNTQQIVLGIAIPTAVPATGFLSMAIMIVMIIALTSTILRRRP